MVCDYYSGMQVLVPLDLSWRAPPPRLWPRASRSYYKDGATVSVHALNEPLPENGLVLQCLSGSDRMELYLTRNAAGDQMMRSPCSTIWARARPGSGAVHESDAGAAGNGRIGVKDSPSQSMPDGHCQLPQSGRLLQGRDFDARGKPMSYKGSSGRHLRAQGFSRGGGRPLRHPRQPQ